VSVIITQTEFLAICGWLVAVASLVFAAWTWIKQKLAEEHCESLKSDMRVIAANLDNLRIEVARTQVGNAETCSITRQLLDIRNQAVEALE
jgi:hypothetical protein